LPARILFEILKSIHCIWLDFGDVREYNAPVLSNYIKGFSMFVPNLSLYTNYEDSEKVGRTPYIAVFKKDGKTLLYICDRHCANVSFDMVDFCFSEKSPAIPEIAVIEYERAERAMNPWSFHDNTIAYAGAIAAKRGLPVAYADLSQAEMLHVLRKKHPQRDLTEEDLLKTLRSGGPSTKQGEYNLFANELDSLGRDPFMVKNIAAALNEYDVILAIFGEGHYRSQRLILEDMLGRPEYIKDVPNTRGDFNDCKISPIDLGVDV
jgi:hypothetical protein